MSENKKNAKIVIYAIVVFYIILIIYLAYFQVVEADKLSDHSYNSRNWIDESQYNRGLIVDRNGQVLAETLENQEGEKYRNYPYGSLFCHTVGYSFSDYGKTFLESEFNKELLNIEEETPINELRSIIAEDQEGNNLQTTLDVDLQGKARDLLEGHKGSVIVMNPKNGEIYAMQSAPYFNPNNLDNDWETLISHEDSPLLSRSTEGLYTPGSVIKIVTAASIMDAGMDLNYYDEGSIVVDGYTINNFENLAHGDINMEWALVHSSNTYYVDKALELGPQALKETFEKFMFNQNIPFDLQVAVSQHPFVSGMSDTDLAAASYGQGDTLVTPLLMAMSVSAIANGGKMVEPYIVESIIGKDYTESRNNEPVILSQVMTEENAELLQEYLASVVDNYPSAQISTLSSAGKTGTAETGSGQSHAWYVGFAPLENPQFAVAVVLEEDGTLGGRTAAPIGAEMLKTAYDIILPKGIYSE